MKRKKELIIILSSLLVIVLSVSVAYFTTKILGTGKEISVESADLKVIFTSGSGTINGTNIEPGWSSGENTFTVKNESNGTYKYNIIIKDLVNTFATEGFLQYKITSTDGGYNMTDFADVPKSSTASDTILAENIGIEKGTTHTYKIIINYNNSDDVDQSADMGKTLTGKIFITKGTETVTLANKLLENNPIISTRTDFSTPFTTNTANTLYKTAENGTNVYYFAGQDTVNTPINNWVKFGKERVTSCTYNGEEVYYPIYYTTYTDEDGTEYKDMLSVRKIREASECTSVCIFYDVLIDGNPKLTGLTETKCKELGGVESTYIENGATAGQAEEKDVYWRIIRTNENGGLKLLYFGNNPNSSFRIIGYSYFGYDDRVYGVFSAGYMTGNYNDYNTNETSNIANTRKNEENSFIKTFLDDWYENNIYQNYDEYTDKDVIYCNDRSYGDENRNEFGAFIRLETNRTPTYMCGGNGKGGLFEASQSIADKFNVSGQNGGNEKLTYPIALISADEVAYAGGVNSTNAPMWYSTNSSNESSNGSVDWWTMTPYEYDTEIGTRIFTVRSYNINDCYAYDFYGVRPVVSLKACTLWSHGDGSADNPYEIIENGGC